MKVTAERRSPIAGNRSLTVAPLNEHRNFGREATVGRRKRLPHESERGFALLLVFLMAAVIGITIWAELPRVAIQSQRAKEQLLVERGEQFKRAIQLFLRANKGTRFPADMDDLDRGFNNLRFLRHRYKDPMTGKDEWRIIHMQGGVLTDSLLNKPKQSDKPEESTLGQNISAQLGLGEVAGPGQASPNATNRRRPSEGGSSGGIGPDGQPIPPPDQGAGTQPGSGPGGMPQPGIPGMPGGPASPFSPASGSPGIPGMPGVPGQFPGMPPGMPGNFGQPGNNPGATNAGNTGDSGSMVGGNTPSGAPGLSGGMNPANPASGMIPGSMGPNSTAANMMQNLLSTPRQNGPPGVMGQGQGTTIGGGMAGVASKMEAEGLMVYKDRTNYKEWEFVYDPTKDRPRQDPRAMMLAVPAGTPVNPAVGTAGVSNWPGTSSQPAQNATNAPSGPGTQTGTNNQPGAPSNTGTSGQGGPVDIRPGKK